jgi:FMN phosphatase YigB (HAD superfamily)
VLKDLGFPEYMVPIILSEEEGVEKPGIDIFHRTLKRVNEMHGSDIREDECLHIGDELDWCVLHSLETKKEKKA